MNLAFLFRSLIHFELIIVLWSRCLLGVNFYIVCTWGLVSLCCMWMSSYSLPLFFFPPFLPAFIPFSFTFSFFLMNIYWPPGILVMFKIFQWLSLTLEMLKSCLLSNWPKPFWILFRYTWYCIRIYIRLLYRMVWVVFILWINCVLYIQNALLWERSPFF